MARAHEKRISREPYFETGQRMAGLGLLGVALMLCVVGGLPAAA